MKTILEVLDALLTAYERSTPCIDQRLVRRVLAVRHALLRGRLLAATLVFCTMVTMAHGAVMAPADMQQYADNAIMNAAQHGYKKVTLVFGHANPSDIEDLAQELRDRGYRIDEEAQLINPMIIKVQYLKPSAVASIKKPEVIQ